MLPRAKVLIVDDSRIFRTALETCLSELAGIQVVGSVFNGQKALEFIQVTPPDVVTLDVEMPGMDGLAALKAIQRFNVGRPPGTEVGVVMVSAYTKRGADVTMQALQDGAFDFVTKPTGPRSEDNLTNLRQQLGSKIQMFVAGRSRRAATGHTARPAATPPPPRTDVTHHGTACNGRACGRFGRLSSRRRPAGRRPWKRSFPISAAASICRF